MTDRSIPRRVGAAAGLLVLLAALAAGCTEETPAGAGGDDAGQAIAAADLTGVEVEMRHEPG